VARLIDPGEAEVAVLTHLAVLDTAIHQGLVPSRSELLGMCVIQRQRYGFTSEPIAGKC